MEPLSISLAPTEPVKPALNIRLSLENSETIELLDTTEFPESFKKDVLVPYLKHVYEDLSSRSSNPNIGIPKSIFIDVFFEWNQKCAE